MAHTHGAEVIEGSFAPRRAAELVALPLDAELLLLDPRTDGLHQLDPLGTVIWSVLDGEATVDELVGDLADAFAAPADAVRKDLGELLASLRTAGALAGTEPAADLLVGAGDLGAAGIGEDGLWRPAYLVDPPAP